MCWGLNLSSMYGCAVPLAIAEPAAELGEALVEDVAPKVINSEAVVAPFILAPALVDTLVSVAARTTHKKS